MRNRSTRVIVGLLLLTGIATSGLKQAGLLTGQVVPTLSCSNASTTLTFSEGSPNIVPATMESFPRYGTNNNPPHYAPLPYSNPPSYQSAGVRISVDPVVSRWVYVAAGLPPLAAGSASPSSPGGTLISTIMQSGTPTGTPTELPPLVTTIAFVDPSSGAAVTAIGSSISMWVYSQAGTVNLKSFDAAGNLLEQKSAPASSTVQFATGNVARIELESNYAPGGVAIDNLRYALNLACAPVTNSASVVLQNARMQFRVASPHATMDTNGVITVPTGSNVLLDWSEVGGMNNGSMMCYLYASRAIDGLPAGKNDTITVPNYGVRQVNGVTQDTSFTLVCDNGDGYSPPLTSQTLQVRVGGSDAVLTPYDHRAIQYPGLPVSATFTLTSGSATNGADNVLDIRAGSDVTLSWTSTDTQEACTLQASDIVSVPTEIAAGTLHPGNTYGGGVLSNILNNFFITRRTGSMTLRGVTESFSVLLNCVTNIPPGGGSAAAVTMYRAVYVQPQPQCSDGTDNDGDGKTDLTDPDCTNAQDNIETAAAPQCVDGGYEYYLTTTDAGYGQSGPAPAGGGWTMNDNTCLVSNASAQCVTNAVLWRKPSAQAKEAILTSCADPGGGYSLKTQIPASSPLQTLCLWERNATAPVNLMLGHAGTGLPVDMNCNTSVDGQNGSVDKPSLDYSFQSRICVVNGPGGTCTSDLCLFGKTLNACPAPTSVDIKVNGQDGTITVPPNTPVTVTWTSNGVVSCDTGTAPAPWGPAKPIATSGSQQYTPTTSHTIGIQCTSVGGANRDVQDSVAMVIGSAGQCPATSLNFSNATSYTSVTTQYQAQGVRFSTARTGTAGTGDPKAVVPFAGAFNVYSPSNKSDPANSLSLAAYYSRLGANRPASPAPTIIIEFVTPSGTAKTVPGSSVSFYARTLSDIRGTGTAANPGTATSYDAAGNVLETKALYSGQEANPVSGGYGGLTYDQLAAAMKVQFTTGNIAKIILSDSFTTGVVMDDLSFTGDCNNAACVSNTIPSTLPTGQSFTATAIIGNNGSKTWTGNNYYARIVNHTGWGLTNAGATWAGWPTASIVPGQNATISLSGKTPSVPGNYTYSYQMVQNGVESFGEVCTKTIIVSSPTAQCTTTNPSYCGPKGCPAGFAAYGGHTYLRFDTTAGSWDSARAHCQSIGGDLVSINNAQEQDAVYNGLVGTGRHDIWIGLTDSVTEGQFKWVDGTTPVYTNWHTGNPDDGYFNEDCVELNYKSHPQTGKWNDFRCSDGEGDNTGFICEVPVNCDANAVPSLSCKAAEFDATKGTFAAQGWKESTNANTTISGPTTENGTAYYRIADNSTSGMPNAYLPLPKNILQDKDFVVEMKARIASSNTGRTDLTGGNALIMAPDGRYVALYFDTNKFGTIKNLAWAQTVNRNTSDTFHTYHIAYKKNGTGVTDDTFDVFFDGEKVLTDVKLADVAYIPSQGSDSLTVGAVSTDGTSTMDVAYVKFSNSASPCVTYGSAPQCGDTIDNDGDTAIDFATETEVLVKNWGPVSVSPGGASVVAATGLQAGQFIKPTLAAGGAVCENIMRGVSAGSYYFAGVFTNDAGTYVQASPPNSPASRSIPLVSDPAWPLDIFKVPNGATQLKVSMPSGTSFTGTCTLSGKVFEMQRSPNWPGDPDCSSATDDSEAQGTCTDSDGGNVVTQKGFVNATGGSVLTATDSCNVDGTLKEYFCDANKSIQSTTATCDAGSSCVDGACKAGSSSSAPAVLNPSRTGFGGLAFDGSDIIFSPLQNGDLNSQHGNVLSFGPVCKPGLCGDGTLTSDEQCDDGNTSSGDGCNAKCIWEPYGVTTLSSSSSSSSVSSSSVSSFAARCGDSIITAPEKCDDGNARGGDGCSAFCQIENGWQCTPRLP